MCVCVCVKKKKLIPDAVHIIPSQFYIYLFQCNLDYFIGRFDIGVCLHACGVATDLVLQCCLDKNASFVICPCCYGNIQNTHTVTYPRSNVFREFGLTYKVSRRRFTSYLLKMAIFLITVPCICATSKIL